jgi:hypothetical protein
MNRYYNFVLPPGWVRLDLRGELAGQAQHFADVMLAEADPTRKQELSRTLQGQVLKVAQQAKQDGVLDLVLPAMMVDGSVFNASFAIMPFDPGDGLDPVEVLAGIAAADSTASLVEIRDLVALRTLEREAAEAEQLRASVVEAALAAGAQPDASGSESVALPQAWSRRVRYFLGDPARPDGWVIVAFAALEVDSDESRQFTDALVELFDEIVLTVRFPE